MWSSEAEWLIGAVHRSGQSISIMINDIEKYAKHMLKYARMMLNDARIIQKLCFDDQISVLCSMGMFDEHVR